jgi:hypothetical protein
MAPRSRKRKREPSVDVAVSPEPDAESDDESHRKREQGVGTEENSEHGEGQQKEEEMWEAFKEEHYEGSCLSSLLASLLTEHVFVYKQPSSSCRCPYIARSLSSAI